MSTNKLLSLASKFEIKLASGNTKAKLAHALQLAKAIEEATESSEEQVTRYMLGLMAQKVATLISEAMLSLNEEQQ